MVFAFPQKHHTLSFLIPGVHRALCGKVLPPTTHYYPFLPCLYPDSLTETHLMPPSSASHWRPARARCLSLYYSKPHLSNTLTRLIVCSGLKQNCMSLDLTSSAAKTVPSTEQAPSEEGRTRKVMHPEGDYALNLSIKYGKNNSHCLWQLKAFLEPSTQRDIWMGHPTHGW